MLTDLNGPEAFGYELVRPSIFPYFIVTVTDWAWDKILQNINNTGSKDDIIVVNMFFYS